MRVSELITAVRQLEIDSIRFNSYCNDLNRLCNYLSGELISVEATDGSTIKLNASLSFYKHEAVLVSCTDGYYVVDLHEDKKVSSLSHYKNHLSLLNHGKQIRIVKSPVSAGIQNHKAKKGRVNRLPLINVEATYKAIQEVNGDDIKLAVIEPDSKHPERSRLKIYTKDQATKEDYDATRKEFANILGSISQDYLDFDVQDIRDVRIGRPSCTPKVEPLSIFDLRKDFK